MKNFICSMLVVVSLLLMLATPLGAEVLVVTLLGSGMPAPQLERFGPSVLVEAGHEKLLFDTGRGVAQRIYELRLPFSEINKIFITHLHYDHLVGLPDLLMSGWVFQREQPLEVWGPTGIDAHLKHLTASYDIDIQSRLAYTKLSPEGIRHHAHQLTEGTVYERGELKVIAFRVDHGMFKPAWGYRVNYGKRAVVISGDTRYSRNLVKYARGADLLIHEVASVSNHLRTHNPRLEKVLDYHTTPDMLAKVIVESAPRLVVMTHLIMFGVDEDALLSSVLRGHEIEVLVGQDRMAFDVGEEIKRYSRQ